MTATIDPGLPGWLDDLAGTWEGAGTVTHGTRLRRWGVSEVWRLHLDGPGPRSVIVKRGTGEMAAETRHYRRLVMPLVVPAPRLIAAAGGEDGEPALLVLADLGPDTLEQRPTAAGYRAATRTLARMRATAARRLAADPSAGAGLGKTTADFAEAGRRASAGLAALRPDLAGALDEPVRALLTRLDRSAGAAPTVVHGDFHAKNLVYGPGGEIVPVDWPGAYLHEHLGDLYCLLREADRWGLAGAVGTAELPALFAREAGTDPATVARQLVTGGLCWTLLVIRWLVEEGAAVVPESRNWFDELVADCRTLAAAPETRRWPLLRPIGP